MRLHQQTNDSEPELSRYHLIVAEGGGQEATMQVYDRIRGCLLLDWQGTVVRHLLESGHLPTEFRHSGCYACDKSFVWHLILAGAATQMALDQIVQLETGLNHVLSTRLSFSTRVSNMKVGNRHSHQQLLPGQPHRLGVRLAGPHKLIARLLFAHPEHHFSAEDVQCLLLLDGVSVADDQVSSWLNELVHMRVVQRIDVDNENIFYDINITPHLHLFDSRTRELRDASVQGIICVDHESAEIKVQVLNGSNMVIRDHASESKTRIPIMEAS